MYFPEKIIFFFFLSFHLCLLHARATLGCMIVAIIYVYVYVER